MRFELAGMLALPFGYHSAPARHIVTKLHKVRSLQLLGFQAWLGPDHLPGYHSINVGDFRDTSTVLHQHQWLTFTAALMAMTYSYILMPKCLRPRLSNSFGVAEPLRTNCSESIESQKGLAQIETEVFWNMYHDIIPMTRLHKTLKRTWNHQEPLDDLMFPVYCIASLHNSQFHRHPKMS